MTWDSESTVAASATDPDADPAKESATVLA